MNQGPRRILFDEKTQTSKTSCCYPLILKNGEKSLRCYCSGKPLLSAILYDGQSNLAAEYVAVSQISLLPSIAANHLKWR
jgi:hypothetical protein